MSYSKTLILWTFRGMMKIENNWFKIVRAFANEEEECIWKYICKHHASQKLKPFVG